MRGLDFRAAIVLALIGAAIIILTPLDLIGWVLIVGALIGFLVAKL